MKNKLLKTLLGSVAAVILSFSQSAFAAKILVVDEGSRLINGGWVDLFENTFGDELDIINDWNLAPTDMTEYDIVWDGGFLSNPGATIAQNVINFVNAGGGFYGQTERPCCDLHNAWVESIFKTLTGDNAMQFGGAGDSNVGTGQFLTPDSTILLEPNDIRNTTFDISAPGQLFVSDESKVFAKQTNDGFNIGVAYATSDLVNNAGRLVTISDIDWLNSISQDEANALENIRLFLLDGDPLPEGCGVNPDLPECQVPVPAPSTIALIALGIFGLRMASRIRA